MGGRQVLWAQVHLLSQKCEKMEFKLASRPPEDEELMRRRCRRWPLKTIFISWDNWTERNEHKVTYIITYIFVISALFLVLINSSTLGHIVYWGIFMPVY